MSLKLKRMGNHSENALNALLGLIKLRNVEVPNIVIGVKTTAMTLLIVGKTTELIRIEPLQV